ncbi:MAG: VOC family protein [Anaerolineae bacterium]
MIIGVDHILIAVENVEQAMAVYRRLGFDVQAGGEHPRMGTYNALVPLSDGSYLELIGVRDRVKAALFPNSGSVVAALAHANRLASFALDTNDMVADIEGIRGRGLEIADPMAGERMRPDGQKVAWRTAHFEIPHLPFLIQDITPHSIRVPLPSSGIGAHAFLSQVVLNVSDAPAASRVWQNLLGRIPTTGAEFTLARASVRLAHNQGQPNGIAALNIAIADLDRRVQEMQERGIRIAQSQSGMEIDPADTAGARILLSRA